MHPLADAPKVIRTYGRRRGRRLRAGKQALVDTLLPKLQISDVKASLKAFPEWWLEIGFGGGEHLAHQAQFHPDIGLIGCEPYLNGVGDLLKRVDEGNLKNIRLFRGDARDVIAQLPDASISRVFILFPDPWPKSRHHKRRLITGEFLALLSRVLKRGAILLIATDHVDYLTWILVHMLASPQFQWTAKTADDWRNPPRHWIKTRYQQKAEKEGRGATFLEFVYKPPEP